MLLIPCSISGTTGKITEGVFDADNVFAYAVHPINPERTLVISPAGHEMIVSMPLASLLQIVRAEADRAEENENEEDDDEE